MTGVQTCALPIYRLLDMAEITMSEEAECMQNIAKANAPKDEMHDITSDPKKVGNKKAVATSEKGKIDEERKRTSSVADAFMKGQKANQRTLRTDGKTVTYHGNTIASHEGDHVHVTTAGYGHSPSTRGHVNGILRRLGSPGLSVKKGQLYHGDNPIGSKDVIKVKKSGGDTVSEDKDPCWKGYEMVGMKKKGGRKVPNCVPVEGYIEIGEPGRGWRNFGDGFNAKKRYGTKPKEKPESNEPGTGDTYKGSNSGKKVRFAKTVKEGQIDELKKSTVASYEKIGRAHV